jgi:preprotein translocase subunit SecG
MRCQLLVILRLLIVVRLLLIIVILRNTSKTNAEGSQLGKSQRDLGVGDGREDRKISLNQDPYFSLF